MFAPKDKDTCKGFVGKQRTELTLTTVSVERRFSFHLEGFMEVRSELGFEGEKDSGK